MRKLMLILALLLPRPISAQIVSPFGSEVHGPRDYFPSAVHVGTVQYVLECLGFWGEDYASITREIRWLAADSIVITEGERHQKRRVYGITFPLGLEEEQRGRPIIAIEQPLTMNPDIISHEVIHVMIGDPGHLRPEWVCQINDGAMLLLPNDPRDFRPYRP